MAQHNLTKLASQGRAYDETRVWTEDELSALLMLEQECGLSRLVAANYVRNGVMTVEGYNAAEKVGFVPKSLDDMRTEAIAAHTEKVRSELGLDKEVVEPEVAAEVVETEEVAETEVIEVKKGKSKGGK